VVADVSMDESTDQRVDGTIDKSNPDMLKIRKSGTVADPTDNRAVVKKPMPTQLNKKATTTTRPPNARTSSDKQTELASSEQKIIRRSGSGSGSGRVGASRRVSAQNTNSQPGKKGVEKKLLSQLPGRNVASKARRSQRASRIQSKPGSKLTASADDKKVQEDAEKEKLVVKCSAQFVVLARKDSTLGAVLCQTNACTSGVIPTDSKFSNRSTTIGNKPISPPPDKLSSSDGGAVYAYFPAAKLLLMAVCLTGSSNTGLSESHHDERQSQQLNSISYSAAQLVGGNKERNPGKDGIDDSGRDLGVALVLLGKFQLQESGTGAKLEGTCQSSSGTLPPLLQGAFDAISMSTLIDLPSITRESSAGALKSQSSLKQSFNDEHTMPPQINHILVRDFYYFLAATNAVVPLLPPTPSVIAQKCPDEASLVRSRSEVKVSDRHYHPATALFSVPAGPRNRESFQNDNGFKDAQVVDTQQSLTSSAESSPVVDTRELEMPPLLFEGSLLKQRFEVSRLYKTPWKLRFLRLYPDRLEYGKWNRKNKKSKHYGTLILRKGSPLHLNSTLEVLVSDRKNVSSPRTITLKVQPSNANMRDTVEDQSGSSSSSGSSSWITCTFQDDPMDKKQKGAKFLAALIAVQNELKAAAANESEHKKRTATETQQKEEAGQFVYTPGNVLGIPI